MLRQFFGSRKSKFLILAAIIILVLLALAWRGISLGKASAEVVSEPVLKVYYCGAQLEELCLLSFGRNAEEKMAINFFVPDRSFPDFYLKINRKIGESLYECEKNKEVPTSVYCYGDLISLNEKLAISLLSKKDGHLVAAGNFRLNAILISAQTQDAGVDVSSSPTPTSYPDPSYPNSLRP